MKLKKILKLKNKDIKVYIWKDNFYMVVHNNHHIKNSVIIKPIKENTYDCWVDYLNQYGAQVFYENFDYRNKDTSYLYDLLQSFVQSKNKKYWFDKLEQSDLLIDEFECILKTKYGNLNFDSIQLPIILDYEFIFDVDESQEINLHKFLIQTDVNYNLCMYETSMRDKYEFISKEFADKLDVFLTQ